MSFWILILIASVGVLSLGLLFTLLIVALDAEAEPGSRARAEDGAENHAENRRWTSIV